MCQKLFQVLYLFNPHNSELDPAVIPFYRCENLDLEMLVAYLHNVIQPVTVESKFEPRPFDF